LHNSKHGSTVGFCIQAQNREQNNLFKSAKQLSHAYNVDMAVATVKDVRTEFANNLRDATGGR
jgi:hypothetical protein